MKTLEIEARKFVAKMEDFFSRKGKYPGFGWSWNREKVEDAEKEVESFKKFMYKTN